jgi:hypothetical protein
MTRTPCTDVRIPALFEPGAEMWPTIKGEHRAHTPIGRRYVRWRAAVLQARSCDRCAGEAFDHASRKVPFHHEPVHQRSL